MVKLEYVALFEGLIYSENSKMEDMEKQIELLKLALKDLRYRKDSDFMALWAFALGNLLLIAGALILLQHPS